MSLATDLQKLIEQSCHTAWTQFDWIKSHAALYGLSRRTTDKWSAPGEPAFVSMLVDSPLLRRRLARAFQSGLPRELCRESPLVSGVFHAQPPRVRFGRSVAQVPLADLLLVRHHFQDGQTRPEGRALLLRAKASTTPRSGRLTGRDAQQFDLYADWTTPFAFANDEAGPPPSGERWVLGAETASAAVYGIVSSQRSCRGQKFPDNCPWAVGGATAPAPGTARESRATLSLAAALAGFATGEHGRPWHVDAGPDDHWSTMVRRLLERSVPWEHQVQRVGGVDLPKRRAALSFIQSFLSVEVNAKLTSTIDREESFEAYVDELIASVDSVGRQARDWAASTKTTKGAEEPPVPPTAPEGAPAGISVLYLATFGEAPLAGARADWLPDPEPPATA